MVIVVKEIVIKKERINKCGESKMKKEIVDEEVVNKVKSISKKNKISCELS